MRRGVDTHAVVGLVHAEIDGDEGEPDDARRVHGEGDVLGLVEVGGDAACLERVHGAQHDEDHVVEERQGHGQVRALALQDHRAPVRVDEHGAGEVHADPRDGDEGLREGGWGEVMCCFQFVFVYYLKLGL